MITRFSKIVICLLGFACISSCGKKSQEGFEIVPHLEWRGAEFITGGNPQDNRRYVILKAYFNDRDGDIGIISIDPNDTCSRKAYNLYIRYFEKVSGSYKEILPADTCQPFHNTLPNLTPEGQNKVLEGEINATFSFLAFPKHSGVDSVKFELQLRDRADNLSNLVTSPPIYIPQ